jgi:prolipoprotein diacylglyceryl transferase
VTVASIPSPASNGLHIGPFFFHAYGIMYVLAVLAAVLISRRRWAAAGGDPALVNEVALWGFPAGLIGGRLYFIATSYSEMPQHWWGPFAVWDGGLGIWGGIAAGTLAGLWVLRRRRANIPMFMDAAAPALLVAQSIGRVGNYFNQELFGGPTSLPWGLEISPAHRPVGYEHYATFQPTFLYEIIWNLSLAAFLVWLGHRRRATDGRPAVNHPGLFALYVAGYSGFRIFEELLRVDPAHHIFGLRLNFFVATFGCIAGLVWFARIQWGWPRSRRGRAVRAGGALGLAWAVTFAAGCGDAAHRAVARVDAPTAAISTSLGRSAAVGASELTGRQRLAVGVEGGERDHVVVRLSAARRARAAIAG